MLGQMLSLRITSLNTESNSHNVYSLIRQILSNTSNCHRPSSLYRAKEIYPMILEGPPSVTLARTPVALPPL